MSCKHSLPDYKTLLALKCSSGLSTELMQMAAWMVCEELATCLVAAEVLAGGQVAGLLQQVLGSGYTTGGWCWLVSELVVLAGAPLMAGPRQPRAPG